jgi:hypothetical protein
VPCKLSEKGGDAVGSSVFKAVASDVPAGIMDAKSPVP